MTLRCLFRGHLWSLWREYESDGQVVLEPGYGQPPIAAFYVLEQRRICVRCGREQRQRIDAIDKEQP